MTRKVFALKTEQEHCVHSVLQATVLYLDLITVLGGVTDGY